MGGESKVNNKQSDDRTACSGVSGLPCVGAAVAAHALQVLSEARRILVITKFSFMGDTIVATPFLKQLRQHFPNAHISLLTSPAAAIALEHIPYVDCLTALDNRRTGRLRHTRELLAMLRAGDFDAGFLLNRSLNCAVVCALAGVPMRIGYNNEFRRPFLDVPIPYSFDRNEVDCHLDMLRAIGLEARDALPDLWFTEEERQRAGALLQEHGWEGGRPLIAVQPGSNDADIREWGAERFAAVADAVCEEIGGRILLMGGKTEQDTARATEAALKHRPVNLVGKLSLRDALSVIGLCNLWLGNDTGLLHAAVAQRVPSVGIFGPNKVVRWGYDTPRHRSVVVFSDGPAQDDATVRQCLDAITEEQVLEAAFSVYRQPEETVTKAGVAFSSSREFAARAPYFAATLHPERMVPARRR